jgi:hypothetical protein
LAVVGVALIVFGLSILLLTEGLSRLSTVLSYVSSRRRDGHRSSSEPLAHPGNLRGQLKFGSHRLARTLVRTAIRSTTWLLGR